MEHVLVGTCSDLDELLWRSCGDLGEISGRSLGRSRGDGGEILEIFRRELARAWRVLGQMLGDLGEIISCQHIAFQNHPTSFLLLLDVGRGYLYAIP